MAARRRAEAVRLVIPRLEPNDAFVVRLAEAARASRPSVTARRPLQSLRVGLATAGVVGISVGGAWAAGSLSDDQGQDPPGSPVTESGRPISPESGATTPTGPPPTISPKPGKGHRDQPRAKGGKGRAAERGRQAGRPDELPGKGLGRDLIRPPTPFDPRDAPKGTGGGRPSDSPR
jgi:hypothetical protein